MANILFINLCNTGVVPFSQDFAMGNVANYSTISQVSICYKSATHD